MKEKAYDCGLLELEVKSAQVAINWGERFMRYFVERVCTGCSSIPHTQAFSSRERPNAVFAHAQVRGEYLDGYRAYLHEGGQALLVGEAGSDEERGGSNPRLQDDGDIVVIRLPARPVSLLCSPVCQ